ncbi:MAG: hypothetical protein HeimC3_11770 [Candidatus Heimdallarchaeota archaeon LC_3]|nr:MAG: hypothetical protein HeimC3_11770 [Candidatus Heimdallarchaeota archaeon LC_3]
MSIYQNISLKLNKFDGDQVKDLISNINNPVTLAYLSKFKNNPITVPIWIYTYNNKFYIFTGKKSRKVQSIEFGNVDISLLIINRKFYPHPESDTIPYIGINGVAKIAYYKENPNLLIIYQKILLKYDENLSQGWIKELYEKIENNPSDVWLIEINPTSFYSSL